MQLTNPSEVMNALKSYLIHSSLDFLAWLRITSYFGLETQGNFHTKQLEQC